MSNSHAPPPELAGPLQTSTQLGPSCAHHRTSHPTTSHRIASHPRHGSGQFSRAARCTASKHRDCSEVTRQATMAALNLTQDELRAVEQTRQRLFQLSNSIASLKADVFNSTPLPSL